MSDQPGPAPLTTDELHRMNAWWRAANYLSVGQIYLLANPLLREPLRMDHVKPRLLGHWGTTPGLNFLYVHLNRIIRTRELDLVFIAGPGHGAPGVVASTWLEGTYSETYPNVSRDAAGMHHLFRQFSFPGGIPSHAAPDTPGSIHEGGELGYSLSHAFGAVLDNPELIAACVVGDGEAETGPLATSWHSNKFLNPAADGAVLPILHLNGYKIANPTVLARIPTAELHALMTGYGYDPIEVAGSDPERMHQAMAAAMDRAFDAIRGIQQAARAHHDNERPPRERPPRERPPRERPPRERPPQERPRWPMIILRSPKGWTGPKTVDGLKTEGFWRAHQVPFTMDKPEHLKLLDDWMRSYRPEELFDDAGRPIEAITSLSPVGARRMSANPHTNGGLLMRPLRMPDFADHAVNVPSPGAVAGEATRVMGTFLRDVMRTNAATRNFRVFSPDENNSNRLNAVLDVTNRAWDAATIPEDDHLAPDGRVMEILSEHTCQGWLEGYLLTGRHGLLSCYEAFIHIVDSMVNQHAKWLKSSRAIAWRRPIASLNYLLTSHVWRQDHNGFSHQDPGFIDYVVNKKADIVRVYLPPDANTLLWVTDHCLRSWDRINVIVAGKEPEPQWLAMADAIKHCTQGIGIWPWASSDLTGETDVVMGCAGDVPTLEVMAAVDLLHRLLPDLRVRVVNVVDLMTLQPHEQHPHGLTEGDFTALFTTDKPVIFAFHGYPALIHRLVYKRTNHDNFHVRGFMEEGTTTTPFDMVVRNRLDRLNHDDPLAAFVFDLGPVGAEPVARHLILAYDDFYSIEYFHQRLRPYWRRSGFEAADLLLASEREYDSLRTKSAAFDDRLMADLTHEGGAKYARLAALAYRQSLAAHKLVVAPDGFTPYYFPKENFSCGCIATVDVIYPAAPILLLLNPRLVEASLAPVMDYVKAGKWPFPYAPHDLGTYPLANGRDPAKIETMPVEESGNILILFAAIAKAEGRTTFAEKYAPILEKWAGYLADKGLDPENQLCTDDFAGHLAHNTNLSIKAILGLGAYAEILEMQGKHESAQRYRTKAQQFADRWVEMASDGDHYRLAFDKPGTWSQKYNLVWDRLLGLNLFPADVARKEIAFYENHLNRFGLPLDNRKSYTKVDWEVWTATLAESPQDWEKLISPIYDWVNQSPTRVPLTDWYWTRDGTQVGFQARSVVGGLYIKMLADPDLWKAWVSGKH